MSIKHTIKAILKSNALTGTIYRKIAYARADFREWKQEILPIYQAKWKSPDAVFLVMTPEHGNLGDHAIALAEQKLLKECGIPFIEITTSKLQLLKRTDYMSIMDKRTILVNGGGNLGTLWFGVEQLFRSIIIENPRSVIMCLPNTLFYENSEWGKQELDHSAAIYNAHPNLKLYARETISFEQMKSIYNDVQLMPDMVMSLNKCQSGTSRQGCLLCLRSDCEKTRTEEQEKCLVQQVEQLFPGAVGYTDMVVDHGIAIAERERELEAKFREFRGAELVITDRLHGMIFCAITGTPCIVINSKSHKVCGCYRWIEPLDYIQFCDDPQKIGDIYCAMPKGEHAYSAGHLDSYYNKLKSDIAQVSARR